MKRFLAIVLILLVIGSIQLYAASATANHDVQINIAEIAALALTDSSTLVLATSDPVQAGDVPQGDSDNSRYLRYTTLNNTGMSRKITVSLSVAAPAGTELRLTLSGGIGSSAGKIALTTVAQDLVTAIGSGHTGINATDGDNVQWELAVVDSAQLLVGTTVHNALFTLTEDNF